jgi:serine/threonine protein phosphatase PrpC
VATDRAAGPSDTLPAFGARTDVGRVRTGNEDGYLARPPLFVVADGMGGHNAGEVASGLAVRLIDEALPVGVAPAPTSIASAIQAANAAVWSEARDRPDLAGMGTTCTIVVLDGPRAHVAHVGDSRAYLLRDGSLEQMTSDHTLIASMVREGLLTDEDAQSDERRHIITRAIGAERDVRIDLASRDLRAGDRLLLCSDGLSGQVADELIERVLAGEADPSVAVDRLVELANDAGGEDNVTVIVVDPDRLAVAAPGVDATATTLIGPAPSLVAAPTVVAAPTTVAEPPDAPDGARAGPGTPAPVRQRPAARTVAPAASPRAVRTSSRDGGRWRAITAVLAVVLVALLVVAATRGFGTSPAPSAAVTQDPRASRDVPAASASPGGSDVPGAAGSATPPPPGSLPAPSSGVDQATPPP